MEVCLRRLSVLRSDFRRIAKQFLAKFRISTILGLDALSGCDTVLIIVLNFLHLCSQIGIFNEVCVAIHFGLLKTEDVFSLLDEKPEPIELILTGRYCPPELIENADLVTEIQEIKHYYQKGVAARKGIES